MRQLIVGELRKMRNSSIVWISGTTILVLGVLLADPGIASGPALVENMPDGAQGILAAEAADAAFAFLLLGLVVIAHLLGKQFSDRTIGLEISSGHSRAQVFGSRLVVSVFLPAVLTLLALAAGMLRSLFNGGLDLDDFAYLLKISFLLLPIYIALTSPVMLFVAVFRDAAKSTAASVIYLFMALWAFSVLIHFAPVVSGSSYTDDPGILLMLHPAFLVRLVLNPSLEVMQAVSSIAVSIGWTAVFVGMAWAVLRRGELR